MSDLVIRDAQEEDLAFIVTLWQQNGFLAPEDDPVHDIALLTGSGHGTLFVADLDGQPVATALVGHDGLRGWIDRLAVDPNQQRRGIGSVLIVAAEAWLLERGVRRAHLLLAPDADISRLFYENIGYERQPQQVFSRWIDDEDLIGEDDDEA